MKAKIKEPGLFGKTKYLINGDEIKEALSFGKTLFIIHGNEVKEARPFGKTLYVIDGKTIKEPKAFGKTLYIVDGNRIKEPGMFGKTVYILEIEKNRKESDLNEPNKSVKSKTGTGKPTLSKSEEKAVYDKWLVNSTEEERKVEADRLIAEIKQGLSDYEKKMKKRK